MNLPPQYDARAAARVDRRAQQYRRLNPPTRVWLMDTMNVTRAVTVALEHGREDVAMFLISNCGALAGDTQRGRSGLFVAVEQDSLPAVEFMLRKGGRANSKDFHGFTPLHAAAEHGSVAVARRLVEAGARPRAVTKKGITPLMTAAHADNFPVTSFLVEECNVPVDDCDRAGHTALHWACSVVYKPKADVSVVRNAVVDLLLRCGANPSGQSCLEAAVRLHHARCVVSLLQHDPTTPLREGSPPCPYIRRGYSSITLAVLLSYGWPVSNIQAYVKSTDDREYVDVQEEARKMPRRLQLAAVGRRFHRLREVHSQVSNTDLLTWLAALHQAIPAERLVLLQIFVSLWFRAATYPEEEATPLMRTLQLRRVCRVRAAGDHQFEAVEPFGQAVVMFM